MAAAIIGARQRWSKQKKTISGFNWKATHNCESHMATRAEKRQPIVCWICINQSSISQLCVPSFSQKRAKWRRLQLLIFRHQHHCSRGRCILFTRGYSSIFRLASTIEFAELDFMRGRVDANPLAFGCIPHPPVLSWEGGCVAHYFSMYNSLYGGLTIQFLLIPDETLMKHKKYLLLTCKIMRCMYIVQRSGCPAVTDSTPPRHLISRLGPSCRGETSQKRMFFYLFVPYKI